MKSYPLSIISATGKIFEGPVESLIAPGAAGSFGVLANHIPMVAALKKGPLKVKQGGQEISFSIGSGILEIDNKRQVLVLADTAVKTTPNKTK